MKRSRVLFVLLTLWLLALAAIAVEGAKEAHRRSQFLGGAESNSRELVEQGRQIVRFDIFGNEAFWGGQLHLQQPVSTLSPRMR